MPRTKNRTYLYYVEGECERALINTLRNPKVGKLVSGKVKVLNPLTQTLTSFDLLNIRANTTIILVYDTDVKNDLSILKENIKKLKGIGPKVINIQQNKNFEDEILRASSKIEKIDEVFGTSSLDEFKKSFLSCQNLMDKLNKIGFDIKGVWTLKNKEGKWSNFWDDPNYIKL